MFLSIYHVILYFALLFLTIFLSKKLQFYDQPNSRKIHQTKILNTSGLPIIFFLLFIASKYELSYEIEQIIVVGSVISFVGFLDDRKNLTPGVKLVLLFFPILYLIFNGFDLENLGIYEIIGKIELNKFGILFTILSVGLLVNSYNYIDGIDGLLLSISLTTILYLNFLIKDTNINSILIFIILPIIINLFFNFLPSKSNFKIFSGNTGSLFLGFLISFLIIFLFKFKNIHPAYLIWSCWLPVFDFIYVTFYRIIKNKKFFEADKKHFHHSIILITKGSHLKACIILNIINIVFIIIGYLLTLNIGKFYSILLFCLLFIIFACIRNILNRGVEQSGSSSGS